LGGVSLELRTHDSIAAIGEARWNRLLGPKPPPFLRFSFLHALEASGCVKPEKGWLPLHLGLYRSGELVAAAPAYVKGNSEGEFVFDHSWARFAYDRLGVEYYPKLILAVPFTPATGPRLLVLPSVPKADRKELLAAFVTGLRRLVESAGLSSAHVLFAPEAEARELSSLGLVERHGIQFHWQNPGYATFDDFLSRFDSKRRNQIRRERRELKKQKVELSVLSGERLSPENVDAVYEFYTSTVNKFYWGRQYLNRAFFEEICASMPDAIHVVLGRDSGSGKLLGGAFNLLGSSTLYGRYWGAREERPFLHFNVCFYEAIDWCIARGVELFEPGAGGEHKVARGFEPSRTFSLHHLADPGLDAAVRDHVMRERDAISGHMRAVDRDPVLKRRKADS
jgi:predicted N-acyltransferase